MTTMRPIGAQYDELARLYGEMAVWNEMENVSRLDDDDEVTPEDRLARVRDNLTVATVALIFGEDEKAPLRESLAEVNACLKGDAGAHRDLLERLKARLEAALQ